jgi:hypothetical protein
MVNGKGTLATTTSCACAEPAHTPRSTAANTADVFILLITSSCLGQALKMAAARGVPRTIAPGPTPIARTVPRAVAGWRVAHASATAHLDCGASSLAKRSGACFAQVQCGL